MKTRDATSYAGLAIGLAAVGAALVAALGPATQEQSTYRWPPEPLPQQTPQAAAEFWYAPLLLVTRVPASMEIAVPCEVRSTGTAGRDSTIVLATARDPREAEGLVVAVRGGSLDVDLGSKRVASISWPPSEGSCPFPLLIADGKLTLPGREVVLESSYPDEMPSVSALVSELDLRRLPDFAVTVETKAFATTPTTKQWIASVAAIALALLAVLVAAPALRPRRPTARLGRMALGWLRHVGPYDVAVVGFLVVWTVLAPATVDDGWVWVRQRTYPEIATFTTYFEVFGASIPLYYWLEWLQHWVTSATPHLVIQRLPTLVALVGSWGLARWCCRRALGPADPVVLWTLASVFVLMTAAWGMTIRPEPYVCLLVAASLACALSFADKPRLAPFAVGALAATLAVTAHPQGLAAVAPLLGTSLILVRFVREDGRRLLSVATTLLAWAAVAITFVYLDTDARAWSENLRLFRGFYAVEGAWWWEPKRYLDLFDVDWWATPVRQLSVAVLVLVVAMWVMGPRRSHRRVLDLPALSLTLALLLFTFNPTKSPYHFGAMIVLGAVAAAAECRRLLEARSERAFPLRPLLVTVAATIAVAGSLFAEGFWDAFDLRVLNWDRPTAFGIDLFSSLPWLVVGAVACVATVLLHRRDGDSSAPWRIGAWSIPAASAILVGLTGAVLVGDSLRANWSLARQNLGVLTGSADCGLAESVTLRRGSSQETVSLADVLREEGVLALLEPAPAPYFPCADTPTFRDGVAEAPHFVVGWENQPWPIVVPASPFAGVRDLFPVRRIYYDEAELAVHEVRQEVPGGALLPPVVELSPGG